MNIKANKICITAMKAYEAYSELEYIFLLFFKKPKKVSQNAEQVKLKR
jgi:hypothetical protein